MANNLSQLKPRRVFSNEFKQLRVKEYERGEFTVLEMCKLYSASRGAIYKWIYTYSKFPKSKLIVVEMTQSSTFKLKELQDRIKELERIVGQKQLSIDFLEKMIELAGDQYNIDIKKNFDTPQSPGSGKTSKK